MGSLPFTDIFTHSQRREPDDLTLSVQMLVCYSPPDLGATGAGLLQILKKRIRAALMADGGLGAVAGPDQRGVVQGQ